ncbi:hypothetical protein OG900_23850 [Streptomyces sp. NBC_00433]
MPLSALVDPAELARELTSLADQPQLGGRKRELQALADDLQHGRDLETWAELDLLQAFARPELLEPVAATAARPRGSGAAGKRMWSWVRNVREAPLEAALGVMVFIPLLVTWAGLRLASGAYGKLAKDSPKEASRPFLQLWQSGFDGHLSSYERFDSVALTAVGFIGVLLLLAVWHAWARTRAENEQAAQEAEGVLVVGRLTSVLTRTQLALAAHRNASPQRFSSELTKAAGQLRTLTDRANKTHSKLVQVAEATELAAQGVSAATDRLAREVPTLGAVAGRIETAVTDGAAAVRTAQEHTTRTGQDNVTAVREVGDRIERAALVVDTALKDVSAAQQQLVGLSDQALRASHEASQSMVRSADRTGEAVEDLRKASEQWDAAAAHWLDAAARLDAGIRVLSGATQPSDAAPHGAGATG